MTELRDALERLAERGSPVGADVVYRRAANAASARGGEDRPALGIRRRRAAKIAVVVVTCAALVLGAVALWSSPGVDRRRVTAGQPTPARATPKLGGDVVFGIENESSTWCLPNAQLSASGIEVVSAIYDTLTVPARGPGGIIHTSRTSLAPSITTRATRAGRSPFARMSPSTTVSR